MVSRSVLAACGLAAAICLTSQAQSNSENPSLTQSAPQNGAPAGAPTNPPKLQFQNLPPEPHTPTPAEVAQQEQMRALAAAERLASLQAHWGPDMSTPGLSIALTEVLREKMADGTTRITYHITGTGFAPSDRLSLVRWPLDSQSRVVMSGIGFDSTGTAICAPAEAAVPSAPTQAGTAGAPPASLPATPSCRDSMQVNQPVVVEATAAAGEPIRVALIGADRKHGAATTAVPFPITDEDKGCRLSVMLSLRDAGMVLVDGSGFPPNTPLEMEAVTGAETRTLHPRSDPSGSFIIIVLPTEKGQTAGETTVRFAGINHFPSLNATNAPAPVDSDCRPAVTFHWGKGTYKLD